MTTYNKASLKTFFATGDVPTGTDYANFIDSYVNIVDTTVQVIASELQAPQLTTALVSATNGNFTGIVSAATLNVNVFMASAATIAGEVSAAGLNVLNSVRCSALRINSAPVIISAAGTAQAHYSRLRYAGYKASPMVRQRALCFPQIKLASSNIS